MTDSHIERAMERCCGHGTGASKALGKDWVREASITHVPNSIGVIARPEDMARRKLLKNSDTQFAMRLIGSW